MSYLIEHDISLDIYRWQCLQCVSGSGDAPTYDMARASAAGHARSHIHEGEAMSTTPQRARRGARLIPAKPHRAIQEPTSTLKAGASR